MIEITRRLEFDAGHRVLGHEGKCAALHGHRYAAEITVRSPELDSLGRVVDFGVIKEKVGKWIDDNWDHNMILHPDDPLLHQISDPDGYTDDRIPEEIAIDLIGREPFVMPACYGNPTAENLAEYLCRYTDELLGGDELQVVRVKLFETPNCWAVYEPSGD